MPLMLFVAWHAALGLALSLACAAELRASPRPVYALDAFRALLAHEVLLAAPGAAWMLFRAPDWSLSYLFDASRVPPLAQALLSLAPIAAGLAGLTTGARWVREQRLRATRVALGALMLGSVLGLALARHRLAAVGSFAQYRGGFGLRALRESVLWPTLAGLFALWFASATHLCARAARRAPALRAPQRSR